MTKDELFIREVRDDDKEWIKSLLTERWHSPKIVTRGKKYNALFLPGFVTVISSKPAGLITYRIENNECEIITLDSIEQGKGVGRQLITAVVNEAKTKNCKRVWLITTNDNLKAQEFYKKIGFSITAIHKNAIEESRKLKPEIPLIGQNGIPIKDEIEMEIMV